MTTFIPPCRHMYVDVRSPIRVAHTMSCYAKPPRSPTAASNGPKIWNTQRVSSLALHFVLSCILLHPLLVPALEHVSDRRVGLLQLSLLFHSFAGCHYPCRSVRAPPGLPLRGTRQQG